MDRAHRIRQLNDTFRKTFIGGQVLITPGISNVPNITALLNRVRTFSEFNADNDPQEEHDFASFEFEGEMIFWKIDYYNLLHSAGSPDPADASRTRRVLTVMLAEEY